MIEWDGERERENIIIKVMTFNICHFQCNITRLNQRPHITGWRYDTFLFFRFYLLAGLLPLLTGCQVNNHISICACCIPLFVIFILIAICSLWEIEKWFFICPCPCPFMACSTSATVHNQTKPNKYYISKAEKGEKLLFNDFLFLSLVRSTGRLVIMHVLIKITIHRLLLQWNDDGLPSPKRAISL